MERGRRETLSSLTSTPVLAAGLALLYFFAGKFGLKWAFVQSNATAV